MKPDDLKQMEADQRAYARLHGGGAVSGIDVVDIRPIYQDMKLPDGFGVQRKDAPLHILCFLYPAVVVFVPPSSGQLLEQRFGMSLESFVELQDKGIVKPLIGHPTDYADLPHLDPILKRKPPSVWARGDELAHAFANAGEYWEDARRLIPLERIRRLKWVRRKWASHYPRLNSKQLSKQIDTEICTNYVNLRIFGEHQLAEWSITASDADDIAHRLLALNEFLTYPHLLGIDGTMNYGIEEANVLESIRGVPLFPTNSQRIDKSAEILLSSLKIEFPEPIMADAIIDLHRKGVGKHLQAAVKALEAELVDASVEENSEALNETSLAAQEIIRTALLEARGLAYETARGTVQRNTALAMRAGSLAGVAGVAFSTGAVAGLIAAALAGMTVTTFLSRPPFGDYVKRAEQALVDRLMKRKFSPLATHIWWVDRLKKGAPPSGE